MINNYYFHIMFAKQIQVSFKITGILIIQNDDPGYSKENNRSCTHHAWRQRAKHCSAFKIHIVPALFETICFTMPYVATALNSLVVTRCNDEPINQDAATNRNTTFSQAF